MRKIEFFCVIWSLFVLVECAATPQKNLNDTADLKILTTENPPLNFMKDGEITGHAAEVVKDLIKRTGTGKDIKLSRNAETFKLPLS